MTNKNQDPNNTTPENKSQTEQNTSVIDHKHITQEQSPPDSLQIPAQMGRCKNTEPLKLTEDEKKEREFLAALTRAQEQIKAVMLDPANSGKTNKELMELANVSETTFYRVMKDEEFKGWIKEQCHAQVTARLQPVIDAMIETASEKGRDGTQDRKTALEIAGIIQPKGISVNINNNLSLGGLLDDIDGKTTGLPTLDGDFTEIDDDET